MIVIPEKQRKALEATKPRRILNVMSRGLRMTPEQVQAYLDRGRKMALAAAGKKPKYNNKRTEFDGIMFDSIKESERYQDLRLLQHSGAIADLQHHVVFHLDINGVHVCDYEADFVYVQGDGRVVEDAKGMRTKVYALKKKLMKAVHNIEVYET